MGGAYKERGVKMALKQYDYIENEHFINLLNQIKAEVSRRSFSELDKLYNKYNSNTSYNFPSNLIDGKHIDDQDLQTLLTPLQTINKNYLNISSIDEIIANDFDKIQQSLNYFSTATQTGSSTCQSGCMGMCTNNCTACTGCTSCSGCTGGCTSCDGGCSGGCGWCDGGCLGNCKGCSGHCTGGSGLPTYRQ